jgi:hypothetical protein
VQEVSAFNYIQKLFTPFKTSLRMLDFTRPCSPPLPQWQPPGIVPFSCLFMLKFFPAWLLLPVPTTTCELEDFQPWFTSPLLRCLSHPRNDVGKFHYPVYFHLQAEGSLAVGKLCVDSLISPPHQHLVKEVLVIYASCSYIWASIGYPDRYHDEF